MFQTTECTPVKLLRLQGLQSFVGPLGKQKILGWPNDLLHARDHLMALSGQLDIYCWTKYQKKIEDLDVLVTQMTVK